MNTGSHLHSFSHDEVLDLVCSSLPSTSSILVLPFIPFHTLDCSHNQCLVCPPTNILDLLPSYFYRVSILCLNPRLTLVLSFPASSFHPYLHSACGPCHYLILPTHPILAFMPWYLPLYDHIKSLGGLLIMYVNFIYYVLLYSCPVVLSI
jgi:hypothetical protein